MACTYKKTKRVALLFSHDGDLLERLGWTIGLRVLPHGEFVSTATEIRFSKTQTSKSLLLWDRAKLLARARP